MSKIGRYEVEEEVGRGAMGVVYLAHDPRVRRRVAIKTYHVPGGVEGDQAREYRERFIREAQSAGGLNHPAIVTIYDVDEDPESGASYIAMEYVPGRSLQDLLKESKRLEPERAILLGTSIAEGLHVAHQEKIVHRDVKPGNILVRESDGAFKIADFGVARFSDSELTQTGLMLGSPAYMSPEQIRSREVDGRSDLFSLAAVMYEALAGRKPFEGKDLPSLAYAVVHENPMPITAWVRGLPRDLDGFFKRAMAKEPEDRFPDGKEFSVTLRRIWERQAEPQELTAQADVAQVLENLDMGEIDGFLGDHLPSPPPPPPPPAAQERTAPGNASLSRSGSRSGGYKPAAPDRFLERAQAEQAIPVLDVIPLRKGQQPARGNAPAENPTPWESDLTGERTVPSFRYKRRRGPKGGFILILVAMAIFVGWFQFQNSDPVRGDVMLEVENLHIAGTVEVLLNDELLYIGQLSAPADGKTPQDIKTAVAVPSGQHTLRVQVRPTGEARSYQEQVTVNVAAGGTHRLHIATGQRETPIPQLSFE